MNSQIVGFFIMGICGAFFIALFLTYGTKEK